MIEDYGLYLAMKKKIRAYIELMRLNRPVGSLLLLWPTMGALWISNNGTPSLSLIAIFLTGTFLLRSAGCVVNDYADRDLDKLVARTKSRPLADGRISPKEALILFCLLSALGASLLIFLNFLAQCIAILGLLLTIMYPYMKRYTYLPQLILGLAFSWGILVGTAASVGHITVSIWVYFFASFVWVVAYDTIYALIDRDDDVVAGIKSTAILFGSWDRPIIGVLQAISVGLLLWLGHMEDYSWYYHLSIAITTGLFVKQHLLIRHYDRLLALKAFSNNTWVGFVIFIGIAIEISAGRVNG